MTPTSQPDRLHALDAVRGFALTLGVFFHATMSFLPGIQIWTVQDVSRSPVMGAAFFALHIFLCCRGFSAEFFDFLFKGIGC